MTRSACHYKLLLVPAVESWHMVVMDLEVSLVPASREDMKDRRTMLAGKLSAQYWGFLVWRSIGGISSLYINT